MKPNIADASQEEQLLMLKGLTRSMGVLHEAQVLQLKMWPLVLFTHARKCEERVNLETREIDFVILQTKGEAPKDLEARMEALVGWTKWLLGDDWMVKVKLRNKTLLRRGPELCPKKSQPDQPTP
jgi:hypothetical protein